MVKKYFIFDRFDFLCRFFSRFFYNEFFFGPTKFTRSSSDKPVQLLNSTFGKLWMWGTIISYTRTRVLYIP